MAYQKIEKLIKILQSSLKDGFTEIDVKVIDIK